MQSTRLLRRCLINEKDITNPRYIGNGSYGVAYRVKIGENDDLVIKVPFNSGQEDEKQREKRLEMSWNEFDIMMNIDHPAVLPLKGWLYQITVPDIEGPSGPVIVMPLMVNGNLESAMKDDFKGTRKMLPTEKSINIFGIAAGMAAIHNAGICHGDLKEENIFLNEKMEPIIADFGLSAFASPSNPLEEEVGSPLYIAPEIYTRMGHEKPVDVYAYAITLYRLFVPLEQMAIGSRSYNHLTRSLLAYYVENDIRFEDDGRIPDYIWDLINRCWDPDPSNRPTFMQIVNQLYADREKWMLKGTDQGELERYMEKVMKGLHIEIPDLDEKIKRLLDL